MQVIFFTLGTLSIFATCIAFSLFIITCIGFWNMNIWISLYGKGCLLPCERTRREISYSWGDGQHGDGVTTILATARCISKFCQTSMCD